MGRVGLSVYSFRDAILDRRMGLTEFVSLARELDFEWIELCDRSVSLMQVDEARDLCRQNRLHIVCLDLRNDFTYLDPGLLAAEIERVQAWIKGASRLGAPMVRIWAGKDRQDAKALQRVTRSLKAVIPVAESTGVKLALENHGGITYDPDVIPTVIDAIGSSSLGACADFGWFEPGARMSGLRRLFPYAIHSHAKSYEFFGDDPERNLDYETIGRIAADAGYKGLFSIEFEGPGEDRLPGVLATRSIAERFLADVTVDGGAGSRSANSAAPAGPTNAG